MTCLSIRAQVRSVIFSCLSDYAARVPVKGFPEGYWWEYEHRPYLRRRGTDRERHVHRYFRRRRCSAKGKRGR